MTEKAVANKQAARRRLERAHQRKCPAPEGARWLGVTIGSKRFAFALVDIAFWPVAISILWGLSSRGYAFKRKGGRNLYLHRLAMGVDSEVDHINENKLDNRRSNLRLATRAQNLWNCGPSKLNTSGVRGVDKFQGRWRARITRNGKRFFLGAFSTKAEAIAARNNAALRLHGEFAKLAT